MGGKGDNIFFYKLEKTRMSWLDHPWKGVTTNLQFFTGKN